MKPNWRQINLSKQTSYYSASDTLSRTEIPVLSCCSYCSQLIYLFLEPFSLLGDVVFSQVCDIITDNYLTTIPMQTSQMVDDLFQVLAIPLTSLLNKLHFPQCSKVIEINQINANIWSERGSLGNYLSSEFVLFAPLLAVTVRLRRYSVQLQCFCLSSCTVSGSGSDQGSCSGSSSGSVS